MKKIILIASFLSISFLSISQDSSLDKLFDDGGISTAKNLVKFNVAFLLVGDFSFSYERIITSGFTVEIGAGALLPYYTTEFPYYIFNEGVNNEINNPKSGYSFSIMPRGFYSPGAPESFYIGFNYRIRHYNLDKSIVICNDFALVYGSQLALYKKLFLDYSIGFGYRAIKNSLVSNNEKLRGSFIMPVSIKIAYLF
jgi:hypothetical protein